MRPKKIFISKDDPNVFTDYMHDKEMSTKDIYFKEDVAAHKQLAKDRLLALIGEEIKKLPQTQQEVIIRFFSYEESDAAIAKVLGRNKHTIMERRHRALNTLKRRLIENPYVRDYLEKYTTAAVPSTFEEIADFINKLL